MNKIERVRAVLRNEIPDCTPAGFWYHYGGNLSPRQMADAHLKTYRGTGGDIMKVMQDYLCDLEGSVAKASDWANIRMPGKESPTYQKLKEVLGHILDDMGSEAMAFQTMYGPMKTAVIAFGDDAMMAHSKENPAAVAEGVRIIAETLQEWAAGFLDAGASGIYYAAQFGEEGRFSREEWEQLIKPSDLALLSVADERADCYNILHICGEPDYDFKTHVDWFADYPGDIVNWSVKDSGVSLKEGRALFKRPILGGLNNKGDILKGESADIAREVREVIAAFGQKGLMIGADCTIQGETISDERIQAAVVAAHEYKEA